MMKNVSHELANGTVISGEDYLQMLKRLWGTSRFVNEGGSMFVSKSIVERPFES
jgi:transcription termination factor Rho